MPTMQEVCDVARIPLNDDAKVRYTDATLLGYLNTAIRRAYVVRPDLRFGQYGVPYVDLVLGDNFPLPDHLVQPAADYGTGRAYAMDEEAGNAERATVYMQAFETGIL